MAGTLTALFRMAGAGIVLAREGAVSVIDLDQIPPTPRLALRVAHLFERRDLDIANRAERLTAALNRLGPSYVKLGQFLATRPDIVGREASETLGRLRDEIEPFPESDARAAVERALGRPLALAFATFSASVAAASIAQVHKATVAGDATGRAVAVKVLRPGIRQRFRRDLDTFYAGARLTERLMP